MSKVRIGIAGCGVIGKKHAEFAAAHPGAVVHAVADVRPEAAQQVAAEHGVAKTFPSAEAMLADEELDAIVVALPPGVRGGVGEQALRRGKHLLLEKPPGLSADELHRMAAVRGDRVVGCASSRCRMTPSAKAVAAFLAEGEPLGRLRLVRARGIVSVPAKPETLPPSWRLSRGQNGGGVLVNWGIYDLDYLLGLLGWRLRPRVVLAQAWPLAPDFEAWVPPGPDAETHLAALVRCDDNVALTLDRGEYVSTQAENAWQIIGERASLRLTMVPQNDKQILLDRAGPGGVTSEVIWQGTESFGMLHQGVMWDFIDAIREGRPAAADLDQAIQLQELMDAMYRSAETGEAVTLSGR